MSTSFLIAEAWDEGFEAAYEWFVENLYLPSSTWPNKPTNPYVND